MQIHPFILAISCFSDGEFLWLRQKIREVRLWTLHLRSLEWEHWLRNMEVVLLQFQGMLSFLQITKIRDCTSSLSVLWVSIASIKFHYPMPYFPKQCYGMLFDWWNEIQLSSVEWKGSKGIRLIFMMGWWKIFISSIEKWLER